MTKRPRILLVIPHLGGGGAESVTALLAANLSCKKYDVHLALITETDAKWHTLPPSLTVHGLGADCVRAGALSLLRLVRRLRPRLILSGMAHLNLLVLILRPLFPAGTRVLVRHNGPVFSRTSGSHASPTPFFHRAFLHRADQIICQSGPMAIDLHRRFRIPRQKFSVLHNPVDLDNIHAAASESHCRWTGPGPHLLAVGRLSHEKGFDLLLEAFAAIRHRFPSANLAIAGEGDEESALRAQSSALSLAKTVQFLGRIDNPAIYFPGASLFVLPSRHDAMPNALLEAAAGGLPIVTSPASPGLVALLADKPGVWVAPNNSADALAESLIAALETLASGQRHAHAWIEPFCLPSAIAEYESLIDAQLESA